MSAMHSLCLAYATERPDAVARLGEASDAESYAEFLTTLPAPVAAGVLAASVPVRAAQVLVQLEPRGAAAVVAALDPGSASALLRRLPEGALESVMATLPPTTAERLGQLLHYSPDQAGSRLDPRAPAVVNAATAEQALSFVRSQAAGALHYVYVISSDQRLVGVVNLRELMLAEGGALVEGIMTKNPWRLQATDRLEAIVRHPAWQHVHALPVVDADDRFLGVIRYSAFRALQVELGSALAAPDPTLAASALAELFWLGTGAIGRLAEAALSSPLSLREHGRGS
jgi:Mg/Co/Ni transporter MgtE